MLPKLESGMIPKMQACLDAVEGGVETAAIIDGRVPHSVLVGDLHQQGNRNGGGARMSWQDDAGRDLVRSFGARMAMFVRGEGAYLWDADGRRYLDFLAGIAVNSLGHAHPAFVEAIANAGGHARARLELLRDAAAARARLAAQAPRRHGGLGPRLLRQLRRRGERGRVQARPPARRATDGGRAPADPRPDRRVPRPHDGHARPDRQAVHAGAVPADGRPASSSSTPRSRRSKRRSTTGSRRCSSSRSRAKRA